MLFHSHETRLELNRIERIGQAGQPCTKLAKINGVDMTSVSYLRNDEMPPTGQPPTEADGQS
jgi:hypothetical protein